MVRLPISSTRPRSIARRIGSVFIRVRATGAVLFCLLVLAACGGTDSSPPESSGPESFSFFEVGANTVLNGRLRDRLEDQLGRAGVSQQNVLNLDVNFEGFLVDFFPSLDQLNQRLNGSAGARVEHDTTRLDYRYMSRDRTPFDRVEMTFDNETGKALLVRIDTRRDGEALSAALRESYGEPRLLDWGAGIDRSLVWTRHEDVLIFSVTEAAAGIPEYGIVIYYVNSLRDLVSREEARPAARRDRERDAIRRAF